MKKNINSQKGQLPLISVIIPTRNRYQDLAECLESLEKQAYPQNKIEAIVIDNGSTDGTPKLLAQKFPTVKLVSLPQNIGFAPALNLGGKISQGKYLLITNDDVVFDKNYIQELTKLLESNAQIGIAHGKMFFKNSAKVATPGFKLTPFLGYHPYPYHDLDTTCECDVATGGNMFIRKKLFDQLGGFDEDFFFCGEDYDFCFQAKRLGFKIFYHPKALCWHGFLQSGKPPGLNQDALFAHYKGKFRYMVKNATLLQILAFFPVQIVVGPFYSYFKFGHKTFLPIVKAFIWNLTHLRETLTARKKILKKIYDY